MSYSICLDQTYTQLLTTRAHQAFHATMDDLLLTAFGLATRTVFGLDRLSVMLESHGRAPLFEDVTVDRTVGWFTSEYPVHLPLDAPDDLALQIKRIKECLHQVPNLGIGYGLLYALQPQAAGSAPTKPQVVFNYLGQVDDTLENGPFRILPVTLGQPEAANNASDYALEVIGMLQQERLELTLQYHSTQYSLRTIEQWMSTFKKALEQIIDFCVQRESRELTPSDFDYKQLSLEDLEELNSLFE
jgi:non-ribosomal peptide synthase protein (TIGR01720 family)